MKFLHTYYSTKKKSSLHFGKFSPLPKHDAVKTLERMHLANLVLEEYK